MARMRRTVPGFFVVLLAVAACASPGATPGSTAPEASPGASGESPAPTGGNDGAIEHPTGADEAVLVMEETGGMIAGGDATQLPTFVMLGDGRVIVQGAQTLEFPGPALPPLIERTLTEDGIQEVLEAVEETNLFTTDTALTAAQNIITDVTDTVFTLNANGTEVTVSAYGLCCLDATMLDNDMIDPAEREAYEVLAQLRDALMTIDTSVSADAWEAEGWQPYEPEAFRLYVRDVTGEPTQGDVPEQVREWPTDEDPAGFGGDAGIGDGTTCGVVEGEAGQAWLADLNAANQVTVWTSDGDDRWSVRARPLLPHEEATCPDPAG